MQGKIQRWECPRKCGWSRSWHNSRQYFDKVIEHPYYGSITCARLAALDISNHRCAVFHEWKERKMELGWGKTPVYENLAHVEAIYDFRF